MGPNDGGIKRGDRADTGDNEARPADTVSSGGSGPSADNPGNTTADPSSLAEIANAAAPVDVAEGGAGIDDLTVLDASDPSLGLTNIDESGPGDWAADTGPSRSPEGDLEHASAGIGDDASVLAERDRNRRPRR
ncbi:MAG: hypothetical protein ACK5AZ_10785 [Bryobacteraceae bacterium]